MNMEQILTWALGPGLAAFLSFLLDQNVGWKNWKPAPLLGFSPKAIVTTIGSGVIGLLVYGAATTRPDLVATADPIVQVWFPLLAPIAMQIWHALINKRLTTAEVKASIPEGSGATASASVTADSGQTNTVSYGPPKDSGTNSPGQGG